MMFSYDITFTDFPSIKNTRDVIKIENHGNKLLSKRSIFEKRKYAIEYTFDSDEHEWMTIYLYNISYKTLEVIPDCVTVKIDVTIDNFCTSFELIMHVNKYYGSNIIQLHASSPLIPGMSYIFDSIEYNLLDFNSIKFELTGN